MIFLSLKCFDCSIKKIFVVKEWGLEVPIRQELNSLTNLKSLYELSKR
jgi:hypothetical protein